MFSTGTKKILRPGIFWLSMFASLFGYSDEQQVVIETTLGRIVVALDLQRAPISASNFLRYVDGQHFDNTSFYRTVTLDNDNGSPKIEVIQGGLNVENTPFPGIAHESTATSGLKHIDGALSMARGDPGTASSEFFICIGDQPGLDFGASRNPDKLGFAVFGQVVEGMDIVRRIHRSAARGASESEYTNGQMLDPQIVIETIRRL